MKVGIIRCQQIEDMCPGNTDFKVAKEGKLAFQDIGFPCPHAEQMKQSVIRKIGGEIKILDYTH